MSALSLDGLALSIYRRPLHLEGSKLAGLRGAGSDEVGAVLPMLVGQVHRGPDGRAIGASGRVN